MRIFQMQSEERQINICISKIQNWTNPKCNTIFQIAFFSQRTSHKIISKRVQGTYVQSEMKINYGLKISYTSDERIISVRFAFNNARNQLEKLAQFLVDLDQLKAKKVQYYPFGKNEHTLQITTHEGKQLIIPSSIPRIPKPLTLPPKEKAIERAQPKEKSNEDFIKEKETHLKQILPIAKTTLQKSFSDKVFNLLRYVKELRRKDDSFQTKELQSQEEPRIKSHMMMGDQQRMLERSRSENAMTMSRQEGNRRSNKRLPSRQSQHGSVHGSVISRSSKISQRKLILSSLQVVNDSQSFVNQLMQTSPRAQYPFNTRNHFNP